MKQSIIKPLGSIFIFCVIGLIYFIVLFGSIYEAVVFPPSPERVTLAQAVEMDLQNRPDFLGFDKTLYISITDAIWECASVKQTGYKSIFSDKRRTDAVFTDANKTAVVFIQMDGFYSCQELQKIEILGELQDVDGRPVTYESDRSGTIVIDDPKELVYYFCTHCTPFHAIFLPILWLLLPFIILWLRNRWKTA